MITKSNKVFLRRKALTTSFYKKNKESMEEGNWKIGASIKNNDVCRGLTFNEEEKYLPMLLGVQPKNDNWQKATTDYWNNISKNIPESGIELEIGFNYSDDTSYKGSLSGKEEDKYKFGNPINVIDYILYRYCLVYSHVANSLEDVGKSHKIRFYLHSKAEEIKTNHDNLKIKNQAYTVYLTTLADRDKVENMLRLMNKYTIGLSDDEQDILLNEAMSEKPALFLQYANDKALEMKSFILNCINKQHLRRIENTETIMYGANTILGYTLDESVGFLQNEKNSQILNTLKIQAGIVKATSIIDEDINSATKHKVPAKPEPVK